MEIKSSTPITNSEALMHLCDDQTPLALDMLKHYQALSKTKTTTAQTTKTTTKNTTKNPHPEEKLKSDKSQVNFLKSLGLSRVEILQLMNLPRPMTRLGLSLVVSDWKGRLSIGQREEILRQMGE